VKESERTLLAVLLVQQVYNDIRMIVREELARVGLKEEE
jgi:hypothetical protein